MTTIDQPDERFDWRVFMLRHQYKVMFVSVVVGFVLLVISSIAASWFFSRLSLLLGLSSFFPAMVVMVVHVRERWLQYLPRWDSSNEVLLRRRPPKLEKVEFIVAAALWAGVFVFLAIEIFSR